MRASRSLSFFGAFLAIALAAENNAQYCYSSQSELSSFCVAFSQFQNHTSQETDLYLAFSALLTLLGGGWIAIGIGEFMAGSLMFLLWADKKRERVAVSVRTTGAHTEPFVPNNLPQVEVLKTVLSKEGSYEVFLPWIWASNYFNEMPTADPDKQRLGYHQLHDVFYVDMVAVPSGSNNALAWP
ncbi:hypothetical protein B0O99DRAFT_679174, partial [Bisporella sp. PMI_857]